MVHTTLPKVDKVDTLLAEAPIVPTLVAELKFRAPDDTPSNDDPNLLNYAVVVSWITYCMRCLL
jgi:hypothetical protein